MFSNGNLIKKMANISSLKPTYLKWERLISIILWQAVAYLVEGDAPPPPFFCPYLLRNFQKHRQKELFFKSAPTSDIVNDMQTPLKKVFFFFWSKNLCNVLKLMKNLFWDLWPNRHLVEFFFVPKDAQCSETDFLVREFFFWDS